MKNIVGMVKLKVLFCTNTFEKVSNGPTKFAHLLLSESKNADFEIRVLTEDIASPNSSVYKLRLKISRLFKLFGQFIRMWKYHRVAMKIRKEFEFDVLVYNNAIIGLLSCVFFKNTIGMINDDSNTSHSLVSVFKRKAKLNKRVVFYYIEYLTCHLSRCIIVNSEYLKKNLSQHYNCKESLFKVMNKGIENRLTTLDRESCMSKKVANSILFVKTDFVRGGLFTLIESLNNIAGGISLFIVGPQREHHEQLKKLLEETGVTFELFDHLPPEKIFEKMRLSEIFCVPSKHEAFGVANLEAMAFGCKIVSTNIGGIPEAVGGERFAWLVEPDNPIALRDALHEALNTSIDSKLNEINSHLNLFSSTKIVSKFKIILEACY
jgi:colanic acid/amylovoran biosynthesis glycosyltransferase